MEQENKSVKIVKDSYYYYSIGIADFEEGNFDAALINLLMSINIEPHFKTYQKQAEIFEKLGREAEAFEALQSAYLLNQNNDSVAIKYAEKLFEMNHLGKCADIVNNTIKRNPAYNPAVELLYKLENQQNHFSDKE